MNTINRLDFLRYTIYASESVLRGAMTRGCVTLIKHSVGSCFVHEFQKEGSSILATAVGSLLIVNSYVPPHESNILAHATFMEEFLVSVRWHGSSIWTGAWNEEWDDAQIAAVAEGFGAWHVTLS